MDAMSFYIHCFRVNFYAFAIEKPQEGFHAACQEHDRRH
jgi:hypothetical protein